MKNNYNRTRLACFSSYFTMASIFSLPPVLFVTLREQYGISYTLLGTLVLANFVTQLLIDLIFTVFSRHFNIKKVVRIMPFLTSLGLFMFALLPTFFPAYAFWGLLIATIVFSVAAGLSEVLLSPIIAALPSENTQKDMSSLHSLYAFGVFFVVVTATIALKIFGTENWMYITIFYALLPLIAAVLFMLSPIPKMDAGENKKVSDHSKKRRKGLVLCFMCIFFGGCTENAMSTWISGFMEKSLEVEKTVGDIFGTAMCAILLGFMRVYYGKYGKNISKTILIGMIGGLCCYLVAGLSMWVAPAFIACILTGLFTSMLWPGTLLLMEENLPEVGVAAYALMAAGGDIGVAVSSQFLGIVTDTVTASDMALRLSGMLNMSVEQIGLKAGMLATTIFPFIGVFVILYIRKYFGLTNKNAK